MPKPSFSTTLSLLPFCDLHTDALSPTARKLPNAAAALLLGWYFILLLHIASNLWVAERWVEGEAQPRLSGGECSAQRAGLARRVLCLLTLHPGPLPQGHSLTYSVPYPSKGNQPGHRGAWLCTKGPSPHTSRNKEYQMLMGAEKGLFSMQK